MKQAINALFIFFVIMPLVPTRLCYPNVERNGYFTKYKEMFKEKSYKIIKDVASGVIKIINFSQTVISEIEKAVNGNVMTSTVLKLVAIYQAVIVNSPHYLEATKAFLEQVKGLLRNISSDAIKLYELTKQAIEEIPFKKDIEDF